MNVAPFDLSTRPRVPARLAAASRAVLPTLAALPSGWNINLPPLGPTAVIVAGIDLGERWSDGIEIAVARGPDRGRLTVPCAYAARLLDAALAGSGSFSAPRALGPAERGVLLGVLAPLLDAIGWGLLFMPAQLSADAIAPAAIALRLEGSIGAGVLRLELPASASMAGRDWRMLAGRLAVPVQIELAATDLPASALAELAAGDAVVFESVPFAATISSSSDGAAGASRQGRLTVGAHAAPLRIDLRGEMTLTGDFERMPRPLERTAVFNQEGAMDISGPTGSATTVLAAAPIEVVAELARVTLRGDEVLGLAPGAVLTVAATGRQPIVLRVGGEVWAEGELVDVEGALGVRVTRLVRPSSGP